MKLTNLIIATIASAALGVPSAALAQPAKPTHGSDSGPDVGCWILRSDCNKGQDTAAPGVGFVTDTLGGNGHPPAASSYRFITDTLGGNGGPGALVGVPPRAVDPLAVSYLMGRGLSPSEVVAWTTGICSYPVKDASCFAMFRPAETAAPLVSDSNGFQWGDAGIGAGFALGIVLLAGAGAGVLISHRSRRQQTAGA